MLGKTNACVGTGSGSSGGGQEFEVINKTGAVVNEGDKLWVNKDNVSAGSGYSAGSYSKYIYQSGVISRSGEYCWRANNLYSLSDSAATSVKSFSGHSGAVKYGEDGSTFLVDNGKTYRIDEKAQYQINYFYIGENYFKDNTNSKIVKIDAATGNVVEELQGRLTEGSQFLCAIDGIIYYFPLSLKYVHDGTDFIATSINVTNRTTICPAGVTKDKKYVIGGTDQSYSNGSSYLRICEIIDEDNFKMLTKEEMPKELQEFYSNYCHIVFNPYTGILTAVKSKSQTYIAMKYENGQWTKLPLDLKYSDKTVAGSLTLSDDLTRACVNVYTSSNSYYWSNIVNLNMTKGYAAIPFSSYSITGDTITATAKTSANPDETLTAVTGGDVILPEDTKWGATVTDLLGDVDESGNIVCSGKIDLVIPENAKTIPLSGIGLTKSLRSIDFSNVSVIEVSGLRRMFSSSNLETVDVSNVKQIKAYGMLGCFEYSSNLTSIRLDKLEAVYAQGLAYAFSTCSSLTSVEFPKLEWINTAGLGYAFRGTPITTLSFPSLVTFYTGNALADMGKECTTLAEIHFRADVQSKVEALTGYSSKFGAPSTCTIYFDL